MPNNLQAVSGNSNITLSWDIVKGASSYIIKRSEIPDGPFEQVATGSAIKYMDTSVLNGTTYYYVVSAVVDGIENLNSNEASTTPTAPVVAGNNAILELTMSNGNVKEYDLTATELEVFLTWYDNRSNGTGKSYYIISKKIMSNLS